MQPIKLLIIIIFISLTLPLSSTQPLPLQRPIPYYPCINYQANRLIYPADSAPLHHFYARLDTLMLFGKGKINIVHIGGSHIQADVMTDRLRRNFTTPIPCTAAQRGIIFPYRVGKTNNPVNYTIASTGTWIRCQNSLPPIDRTLGITGIAVSTTDPTATISFGLNRDSTTSTTWQYNTLRLLASVSDTTLLPVLIISNDTIPPSPPDTSYHTTIPLYTYHLPYYATQGTITLLPKSTIATLVPDTLHTYYTPLTSIGALTTADTISADETIETSDNDSITCTPTTINPDKYLFTVNGIIPETDFDGITYHALGVNGASLSSWLRCDDFTAELPLLDPDLVIMAIGVNDANVPANKFDTTTYIANYNLLLDRFYAINPHCAVIFITNNDCILRAGRVSYGPNRNTALVAQAMKSLARKHNAAVWDMYDIMNGLGSMAVWRDAGLANHDRIHFLTPGYTILADLLYNAIIADWLYPDAQPFTPPY